MDATKTDEPKTAKKEKAPPRPKCDISKVKIGSVFSRHSHGMVIGETMGPAGPMFALRNRQKVEWSIEKGLVEKEFSFADQSDETKEVSRTAMIDVMSEHPFTAMTVNYNMKPKPEDVAKELKAGQGSMSDKEWKARVEALMTGKERTMTGNHANSYDEHRRLRFTEIAADMKPDDDGFRLVDPRTLNWLIVDRTRYVLK